MSQEEQPSWRSRLSANLGYLWRELPVVDAIARAARHGFGAVEFHHPLAWTASEVALACGGEGVQLLGVNNGFGAAVPNSRDDFRRDFPQVLEWCASAGGRSIHLLAGIPSATERASARDCLLENCSWAASLAEDRNLDILLEPLNHSDRPGWFLRVPDDAADIILELDRPNVSIQFDAYHVAMEDLDPIEQYRRMKEFIGHVQIAGVPRREEPDVGTVDYSRFFAALSIESYNGWIGCEYSPRSTVEAGLGWRETLEARSIR